jgi:diguanylate cyclase (GGDEF)-like protein
MNMKNIGEQEPQHEETAAELLLKEKLAIAEAKIVALEAEIADLKIDSVTGLPTRRELDKRLAQPREKIDGGQENSAEKEPSNETAILMLDIDNFKTVNDLYGHPNGDVVLRAVADKLREMFRKEDSIARYGGEEIAVILPKTDASRLINKFYDPKAGKPHLTVKTTIMHEGKEEEIEVTLSGGLAAMGPDGDFRATLAQADKALYVAKNGAREKDGTMVASPRDRIVLYSKEETESE